MSKTRIYELAKETGLPNKEVIRRLEALGVSARSHSSSVEDADASRFRESLGKQRAQRAQQRAQDERAEAEQYDIEAIKRAKAAAKARRVAPPGMRTAQRMAPPGQAAAAGAPVEATGGMPAPTPSPRPPAAPAARGETPAPRFRRPPAQVFRPDGSAGVSVGGAEEETAPAEAPPISGTHSASPTDPQPGQPTLEEPERPLTAAERARQGVVRAAPKPGEAGRGAGGAPQARPPAAPGGAEGLEPPPGTRRPNTPPRPGEPIRRSPQRMSPLATGEAVQPRRDLRNETALPKEGSGRRSIPKPIREAPTQPAPSTIGRQAPSRGRPPGMGRGPVPGAGVPKPGDARPAGPGRGVKKGKKDKRRKDLTLQEQFEQSNQPRHRRSGPVKANVSGPVDVLPGITVGEFAKLLGVNATDIVRVLFGMGEMITVTQSMSEDLIEIVASELEAEVNFITPEELEFGSEETDAEEDLEPRAPVVTVMGHVDHGKTLLLDAIRATDVVSGEAGGITQHIGAYQVRRDGRAITFIDTPGHEAFTAMRKRGAGVTDVAILVVAADDGVKPQTVEAIDHIRAADVPIIVAVNKIDLETADPTRVRGELTEHGLIAEEFGGETTMVDVSAKAKTNLDGLLDLVLLQADVMELQANPHREARGTVIEANLDRGRGAVATVLVQNGTLKIGDVLVAGVADCKVRAMFDDQGEAVKEAGPAMPVEVLGWSEVPDAGDEFRVVDDERTARDIAGNRQARERRVELANRRAPSLDQLSDAIREGQLETLNLVVKGDVSGSVEAVADAMGKLELDEVRIQIIRKGVGAVTIDDVNLAETSDAIMIAFNVRPEASARQAIEESGIDLRQYSVIYEAVEDIQNAVKGLLAPEFTEVVTGRATVREVFKVPRAGFVFGCYVTEGNLRRNAKVRVIRDGVVTADDTITSLRRFKDDVTEVATGFECGVGLDKFQDIKEGDEFEVYESREVARA